MQTGDDANREIEILYTVAIYSSRTYTSERSADIPEGLSYRTSTWECDALPAANPRLMCPIAAIQANNNNIYNKAEFSLSVCLSLSLFRSTNRWRR